MQYVSLAVALTGVALVALEESRVVPLTREMLLPECLHLGEGPY